MKFSQRIGKAPVENIIQIEGMSSSLRNTLWNVLHEQLWSFDGYMMAMHGKSAFEEFSHLLWDGYFKLTLDTLSTHSGRNLDYIKEYFFTCEWYEVFDFLEFTLNCHNKHSRLIKGINKKLERELSAYRYVDSAFIQITDGIELDAVNEALSDENFKGVQAHLRTALQLMSNRENPDYRNSIKESILAVEGMAKYITGQSKATLSKALNTLGKDKKIHEGLKSGFNSIYGYTSDADGIRHSMDSESNITAADAKFFLVSCCSFINYLKAIIPSDLASKS